MNTISLFRVRFLLVRKCWSDFAVLASATGGSLVKREEC